MDERQLLGLVAQPIPRIAPAGCARWPYSSWRSSPSLLWLDYLRSVYRSTTLAGTDSFALVGSGLVQSWRAVLAAAASGPHVFAAAFPVFILLSLAVQAGFVFLRPDYRAPWWRVACVYAVMMLFLDPVLVAPLTGAITRVMLPLTVGFNILLAKEAAPTRSGDGSSPATCIS